MLTIPSNALLGAMLLTHHLAASIVIAANNDPTLVSSDVWAVFVVALSVAPHLVRCRHLHHRLLLWVHHINLRIVHHSWLPRHHCGLTRHHTGLHRHVSRVLRHPWLTLHHLHMRRLSHPNWLLLLHRHHRLHTVASCVLGHILWPTLYSRRRPIEHYRLAYSHLSFLAPLLLCHRIFLLFTI